MTRLPRGHTSACRRSAAAGDSEFGGQEFLEERSTARRGPTSTTDAATCHARAQKDGVEPGVGLQEGPPAVPWLAVGPLLFDREPTFR